VFIARMVMCHVHQFKKAASIVVAAVKSRQTDMYLNVCFVPKADIRQKLNSG